MAGQTIINFDGLSGEAAEKLASGMVEAVKMKIETLAQQSRGMSPEDSLKFERLLGNLKLADGNCGNGCSG
jgi:hypothetical protein